MSSDYTRAEYEYSIEQIFLQAYMRLARELPKLTEANPQRVADLSVRDAMAALAITSRQIKTLPEPAVEQVLRQAEGKRLNTR